jgi:hypothetical protein
MSRLSTMSPAALKAMFSPESSDTLIMLLTIYGETEDPNTAIRIADGYTQRISETARDITYGVVSRSKQFTFIPITITLPSEDDSASPRCSITINDVTKVLVPVIRTITNPPKVLMELVLSSSPDVVEASFPGFYITNFTYNADTVQADLGMINFASEPFPAYTFTPAYFPGLF